MKKTSPNAISDTGKGLTVFVPQEALAGEQIPCFALWPPKTRFDKITVQIPSYMKLLEIYNSSEANWKLSHQTLAVANVDENGYLGMLLTSENPTSQEAQIELTFSSSNEEFRIRKSIHLFKPILKASIVGSEPVVNLDKIDSPPIVLRKLGGGTIMVDITTTKESEISLQEPAELADFTKYFRADIQSGFKDLKVEYAGQSQFLVVLEKIEDLFLNPPRLIYQRELDELRETVGDYRKAVLEDEKFQNSVGETIASALLKNLHMISFLQQISEYLHSILPSKVILRNPVDIVKVGPKPSTLILNIDFTDLAFSYYPSQQISVKLASTSTKEIPLYRLFRWESA